MKQYVVLTLSTDWERWGDDEWYTITFQEIATGRTYTMPIPNPEDYQPGTEFDIEIVK